MNLRSDFPVLLRVRGPHSSDELGERILTALVAAYNVVAVHQGESPDGMCWHVSFGENAFPGKYADPNWMWDFEGLEGFIAPLDVDWRRYPDLARLITAEAGENLERSFRSDGVTCELCVAQPSVRTFAKPFGHIQVGRIIVTPPWDMPIVESPQIRLIIEPSIGFGTGHHPSTRLALSLLQSVPCADREVLDVGTGSGILAIAAARLGARRVLAIDCDGDALASADRNVRMNSQIKRVELRAADVSTDLVGQFDLVVANLDADQLESWASQLMGHVRGGGNLVLSGFLAAEAETVRKVLPMTEFQQEGDWCAGIVDSTTAGIYD